MSNAPYNIIRLSDAKIVRITPAHRGDTDKSDALDASVASLKKTNTKIHVFSEGEMPPWDQPDLATLVDAASKRQFIIICDDVSAFVVALAHMALEIGCNTFVVCQTELPDDPHTPSRLEHAGAVVMTYARFVEECALTPGVVET